MLRRILLRNVTQSRADIQLLTELEPVAVTATNIQSLWDWKQA
jgi:hypothetical protein